MEPKSVRHAADGHTRPPSAQIASHGFPVGTLIQTERGPLAVETLQPGELIETRNGGLQPLLGIKEVIRTCRAIKFQAGCFGARGPAQDMLLPEAQPVLIRDWRARAMFGQSQAMVRAGQLVDDTFIEDIGPRRLALYQLDLGRARIVQGFGIDLGTQSAASAPMRSVA